VEAVVLALRRTNPEKVRQALRAPSAGGPIHGGEYFTEDRVYMIREYEPVTGITHTFKITFFRDGRLSAQETVVDTGRMLQKSTFPGNYMIDGDIVRSTVTADKFVRAESQSVGEAYKEQNETMDVIFHMQDGGTKLIGDFDDDGNTETYYLQ